MTVAELLQRIGSSELAEWEAYYRMDPFGSEREDLRAGFIAAPLLNAWRGKGTRKAKPSDWIMEFGEREPQDPRAMSLIFRAYTAACKAWKRRKEK